MLGLGPRYSYRSCFVKLNTLPVQSLYIFLLIMLVHNNSDNFKSDSLIHKFNIGVKINYISQEFILPLLRNVSHILP
jgi:hypothetical protein